MPYNIKKTGETKKALNGKDRLIMELIQRLSKQKNKLG